MTPRYLDLKYWAGIGGPNDRIGEHEIHCPVRPEGERFRLRVYGNGSTHIPCPSKFQCQTCGYKLEPRRKIEPNEAFQLKEATIELSEKNKEEYLKRLKEATALVESSDYGMAVESREDFCNETENLVEFVEIKFEKGQTDVACLNRTKCKTCPRIQPLSRKKRERIAREKEMEKWIKFHAFLESKGYTSQQFGALPSETKKEIINEYKSKVGADNLPRDMEE